MPRSSRPETNPQQTGFWPYTIAVQPGLPLRRRDEKQQLIPVSEAEYLSAGIAPGNEMGVIRIELLEATGNFLLPIRFGIHINGHIQAVQQGARHCRTNLWRKLQGRL
jgi:hypothetical protein